MKKDAECTEGTGQSRWRIDCNWCHCNNGVAACTKRLCIPGKFIFMIYEILNIYRKNV